MIALLISLFLGGGALIWIAVLLRRRLDRAYLTAKAWNTATGHSPPMHAGDGWRNLHEEDEKYVLHAGRWTGAVEKRRLDDALHSCSPLAHFLRYVGLWSFKTAEDA